MADEFDPYSDDGDAIYPETTGGNERAQGYLRQYEQRSQRAGASYDDIMKRRQDAIARVRGDLDNTIAEMRERQTGGNGGVNLPLLALAAGLLAPDPSGRGGNFGSELSRGLTAMGATIANERKSGADMASRIAQLQQKSGEMEDLPLRDRAVMERQNQLANDNARARVESALIRADARSANGGVDPAIIKEWKATIASDPAKKDWTLGQYQEWKSRLGADRNTPATLRELDAVNQDREKNGQPPITLDQWVAQKATSQAGGRERGKTQAENEIALPRSLADLDFIEETINRVAAHPGQKNAFGWLSLAPNMPGGDTEDFEVLRTQLGSQAFLASVKKMVGMGALSDAEGDKLGAAAINLSKTQSRKQFNESLQLFKQQIARTREIVKQHAAQKPNAVMPRPGEVRNGWTYNGGDPADEKNWSK